MNEVYLLVIAFCLIGAGLIYLGLRSKRLAKASQSWPSAAGMITSSAVIDHRDDDRSQAGSTHEARVEYEYDVAGAKLSGNRICFAGKARTSRRAAQAVTARYPAGSTVDVFYDPAKPSLCTLERRASPIANVLLAIGILFPIMGVGVTLALVLAR